MCLYYNNNYYYEIAGLIDDSLSVDLDKLLIQLRPQVGPKWYQFGEAAGIEREILDNYAENCLPEDCIIEMLDYWLRIHSAGKITWRDVAQVLRAIGLRQLAGEIESVYTAGTANCYCIIIINKLLYP